MESDSKLTYYDYWLTKQVWGAEHAVNIITNYYVFGRLFDSCDNYDQVKKRFRDDLVYKMTHDNDVKDMYAKISVTKAGYNKMGDWVDSEVVLENCDVIPSKFIKWLQDNKYPLPYEFKVAIGEEKGDPHLNEKEQQRVDKAVCQGIARTLWEIYPDKTQEDMLYRKEIQLYGNGKLYSADTTLRRWLREVDPRETKTGPKRSFT